MSGPSPQETVERALAAAKSDDCVVIAEETSTANLRWAGNTLTTNGVAGSRQLTVIAIDRRGTGNRSSAATGVVSRAGVRADQIEDVVREAEHAAAEATPAEDAGELIGAGEPGPFGIDDGEPGWDGQPGRTEIGVLRDFAAALGQTLRAAEGASRKLYGFAEHQMESTFLGTSAGLRLRHDQPTGRVELNAKSADMARSAWTGVATRDFTDVDIAGMDAGLAERLGWAARTVALPAGRYETLLPPTAVSDLLVYMYWSAGAKEAAEGRTVFSKPGGGTRIGERLSSQPVTLSSDPRATGLQCAPFVLAHASGPDSSVFDNGLPLGATSWIRDGSLAGLISSRHSAAIAGGAGHPRHRQPDLRHLRFWSAVARADDRLDRARAAAHLPVVHPRGGPADPAAHRAHPGRGLPGGERRGDGGGEQLQVQRVAGRHARAAARGGRHGADAATRVG